MQEDQIELNYTQIGIDADGIVGVIQSIFGAFGFGPAQGSGIAEEKFASLLKVAYGIWEVYSIIALLVSLVLLYGIIYARIRLNELGAKYHHRLHEEEEKYRRLFERHESNGKLAQIEHHVSSENPNDWRLAIIEADIMLEELLEHRGIPGTTIGERLKHMSHDTFHALDDAWAAHKVRNQIAHVGGDFILTKRIANETIARYKKAFDELSHHGHGSHGGGHGHH